MGGNTQARENVHSPSCEVLADNGFSSFDELQTAFAIGPDMD
jgi:hypothetical protein